MVTGGEIRAANERYEPQPLTGVFVGSTSGIGLSMIEVFLKRTTSSKVYIIGRSKIRFQQSLATLETIDSSATVIFVEAQVSLLKEVERVCALIQAKEKSIDLLWLSQGGLSLSDHALTAEGLFDDYAVTYYSRLLFMVKLIPLLDHSSDGRIISILATGVEGPMDMSDPGFQNRENYSFLKAQRQGVTMMSLGMQALAAKNPGLSFLHTNPGMVDTAVHEKWAQTMTGYLTPLRWIMRWGMIPIMHAFSFTTEDAGQLGFYEATDQRYNTKVGRNFFRVWQDGEDAGDRGLATVQKYERDGTQERLLEHTLETFDIVLHR